MASMPDKFVLVGGELFVQTTNQHRHRRHSPEELQALIFSGDDKSRPTHWFEAQLLHYGLQPSKSRLVARMRLFDAIIAGELEVPEHVMTLEKQLKEQWMMGIAQAVNREYSASRPPSRTAEAKAEVEAESEEDEIKFEFNGTTDDLASVPKKKAEIHNKTDTSSINTEKNPWIETITKQAKKESSKLAGAPTAASTRRFHKRQTARRAGFSRCSTRATQPEPDTRPPSTRRETTRRGVSRTTIRRNQKCPRKSEAYETTVNSIYFDSKPFTNERAQDDETNNGGCGRLGNYSESNDYGVWLQ